MMLHATAAGAGSPPHGVAVACMPMHMTAAGVDRPQSIWVAAACMQMSFMYHDNSRCRNHMGDSLMSGSTCVHAYGWIAYDYMSGSTCVHANGWLAYDYMSGSTCVCAHGWLAYNYMSGSTCVCAHGWLAYEYVTNLSGLTIVHAYGWHNMRARIRVRVASILLHKY